MGGVSMTADTSWPEHVPVPDSDACHIIDQCHMIRAPGREYSTSLHISAVYKPASIDLRLRHYSNLHFLTPLFDTTP
jgi:hypothetical protein